MQDVIELPPPEQANSSPFVGDICFIVNGMAIMSRAKPYEQEVEFPFNKINYENVEN